MGGETIICDGNRIGYLHTGGYGHTLGGAVGLGSVQREAGVPKEYIQDGRFEIEVAGLYVPAKASLRAFYDPKGDRVRVG